MSEICEMTEVARAAAVPGDELGDVDAAMENSDAMSSDEEEFSSEISSDVSKIYTYSASILVYWKVVNVRKFDGVELCVPSK